MTRLALPWSTWRSKWLWVSVLMALTSISGALQAKVTLQPASDSSPQTGVRHPDLEGLDPAVQTQLRLARARLERLLVTGAEAAELGDVWGDLGQLYHAYDFNDAALACYAKASALQPERSQWFHLRGLLQLDAGQAAEAETSFRSALSRGGDGAVSIHLARVLFEQGRLEEAAAVLAPLVAGPEVDPAAIAYQGEVALAQGKLDRAAELLDLALSLVPQATRLHVPLARALRGLGDAERAQQHLESAGEVGIRPRDPLIDRLERLPTGETAHTLRGRRAFERRLFAEAESEFENAVSFAPNKPGPRIRLAAALAASGKGSEAINQLNEALRLEPSNAVAHFNLGTLYLKGGDGEAAVSHFEAAATARPDDSEARLGLARALSQAGKKAEALIELRRLRQQDPLREEGWLLEASLLIESQEWAQARTALEEAHGLLPSSAAITVALARLLVLAPDPSLRDAVRAQELALAAFRLDEHPTHAESVALALEAQGLCAEAAVWLREAISRLDDSSGTLRERFEGGLERLTSHCKPDARRQ